MTPIHFGTSVILQKVGSDAFLVKRTADSVGCSGPAARPHYSLTTLIRYAILGSDTERLTLQEIYDAIEDRFAFFRTAGKGWKNSVRLSTSLGVPTSPPLTFFVMSRFGTTCL